MVMGVEALVEAPPDESCGALRHRSTYLSTYVRPSPRPNFKSLALLHIHLLIEEPNYLT